MLNCHYNSALSLQNDFNWNLANHLKWPNLLKSPNFTPSLKIRIKSVIDASVLGRSVNILIILSRPSLASMSSKPISKNAHQCDRVDQWRVADWNRTCQWLFSLLESADAEISLGPIFISCFELKRVLLQNCVLDPVSSEVFVCPLMLFAQRFSKSFDHLSCQIFDS